MRKFDLSLRSSRSSYFATFRHQLTILSKTDALDEEKWLNMLGTFVKDWFRYESHFVHGRDSLVDILKERGLLSESDAVQPLIGKRSEERFSRNAENDLVCRLLLEKKNARADGTDRMAEHHRGAITVDLVVRDADVLHGRRADDHDRLVHVQEV